VADRARGTLRGRRILIVEDEYAIAADLARSLEDLGVLVVGPAASVADALGMVDGEAALDAAVLDISLRTEKVFPVADVLQDRGIPFVFTTGYDDWLVPGAYANAPRFEKPVDIRVLTRALSK
jgi:CheY-like chemotaxis protein